MRYYFIGIGGISMSALALLLKSKGEYVSGSDISAEREETFKRNGIKFFLNKGKNKQKYEEIRLTDVVIYSSAISSEDNELLFAKRIGKKIMKRGELLGAISREYKRVVAVAGSHGKTTTTGLIYNILKVANKKPTLHIGGMLVEEGTNLVVGEKEYFVTEACEYCDNFLYLNPTLLVVTNIEPEHLDYFKTFDRELKSYDKLKKQSKIVVSKDDSIKAENIFHDQEGKLNFTLVDGKEKTNLKVQICEDVNTENIIYAYRACKILGVSKCDILRGIESFKGVKNRFERVHTQKFDDVVFDYAHHPTEIKNTIKAAKNIFFNKKIVFIFQPHTYSRTKNLLKEFVEVLSGEDVVLFKTYAAREKESMGTSARELAEILKKKNKSVCYFASVEAMLRHLEKEYDKNSVLVFVGAGNLREKLEKIGFLT